MLHARCRSAATTCALLELVRDEGGARAIWSTDILPEWCQLLGIPWLDVVVGIDDAQRDLLKLFNELRESAPDKVDAFVAAARALADGFMKNAKSEQDSDAPQASVGPRRPRPDH